MVVLFPFVKEIWREKYISIGFVLNAFRTPTDRQVNMVNVGISFRFFPLVGQEVGSRYSVSHYHMMGMYPALFVS